MRRPALLEEAGLAAALAAAVALGRVSARRPTCRKFLQPLHHLKRPETGGAMAVAVAQGLVLARDDDALGRAAAA